MPHSNIQVLRTPIVGRQRMKDTFSIISPLIQVSDFHVDRLHNNPIIILLAACLDSSTDGTMVEQYSQCLLRVEMIDRSMDDVSIHNEEELLYSSRKV
jgi:hypothetical protein